MNNKDMKQPEEEGNLFGDVTEKLKRLKNIDAPENFEADLFRKINSGKYDSVRNKPVNVFVRKKLIPSLTVIAVAVIVIFMIKTQPTQQADPFSIKPRLREDVIASNDNVTKSVEDLAKKELNGNSTDQKAAAKLQSSPDSKNNISQNEVNSRDKSQNNSTDGFHSAYLNLTKSDIKTGLNFKQVYLDKAQRQEVAILKENMEKSYNRGKK